MRLLNQLLEIDQERVRREKVVLHTIWDRLVNRIKISMRAKSSACVFKIPEMIPGYPLTNIPKTMEYLLKKIQHEGILGVQISLLEIYIAWDPNAIRELAKRKRQKHSQAARPNQVTQITQTRDDDFIDLMIREKIKDSKN